MKVYWIAACMALASTAFAQNNSDLDRMRQEMEAERAELLREAEQLRSTMKKDQKMLNGWAQTELKEAHVELDQLRSTMEKDRKMLLGQANLLLQEAREGEE